MDSGRFRAPASEDSYEAALRAADALFARTPGEKTPSGAPSLKNGHHQAPSRLPMEAAIDARSAPADGGSSVAPPNNGGGRILRSLDETAAPTLADREDTLIPKRRGRKPGSKNKPKAAVVEFHASSWQQRARAAEMAVENTSPDTFVTIPSLAARVIRLPINAKSAAGNRARTALAPAALALANRVPAKPNIQRFGWVRTKLAPGERWKRRLPKVIW